MRSRSEPRSRHRRAGRVGRRRTLWLSVVVLAVAVAAVVVVTKDPPPTAAAVPRLTTSDDWQRVLERLDDRRASAWQAGRPAALHAVYTPSSPSLRADRAMLAAYQARGLQPRGVRLVFSEVQLVSRGPHMVVLAATDRLATMRVRTAAGVVVRLPADQPTAHVIVLRRVDGRWKIAAVRAQASAASS
ncbi:MAG TPA: hypothetical protein VLK34_03220 [Nocardioidaceae bacterium]|nr:hypothetical protein [Nocardioidaceae bacterium]